MNRSSWSPCLAAARALALAGAALASPASPEAATGTDPARTPAPAAASRAVRFTYETTYPVPRDWQSIDVWVPLPWSDGRQKITDLVINTPYTGEQMVEPDHGNASFHVRSQPRGGMPLTLIVKFRSERPEIRPPDFTRPLPVPPDPPRNLASYLKSDALVPVDAETKSVAERVTKGHKEPVAKARAIYDWVVETIRLDRSGEGWGRGDLRYALTARKGNCTDLNAVFTGLARASGLPARMVMGFRLPEGGTEGSLDGYHCWSEFWLEGFGWTPVDPALAAENPARRDALFGGLDANRIQMSVGRDVVLRPPQNAEPINFWLYPYAEREGQPVGGAVYRFKWSAAPPEEPKAPQPEPPPPASR